MARPHDPWQQGVLVHSTPVDDAELLEAWRGGDRAAGNDLVRRHFRPVYRFFARRVGDEPADDAVQRTFEGVVQGRDRFEGRSTFRAYLFGVARKQLLQLLRERDRQRGTAQQPDVPATTPTARIRLAEEQKILLVALRTLPLDLQICVELFYWEEMKNVEIADVLEIPLSTVTSRLWRARELIRESLGTMDLSAALRRSTTDGLERWAASLREVVGGSD